jgi:hypothetical protein
VPRRVSQVRRPPTASGRLVDHARECTHILHGAKLGKKNQQRVFPLLLPDSSRDSVQIQLWYAHEDPNPPWFHRAHISPSALREARQSGSAATGTVTATATATVTGGVVQGLALACATSSRAIRAVMALTKGYVRCRRDAERGRKVARKQFHSRRITVAQWNVQTCFCCSEDSECIPGGECDASLAILACKRRVAC